MVTVMIVFSFYDVFFCFWKSVLLVNHVFKEKDSLNVRIINFFKFVLYCSSFIKNIILIFLFCFKIRVILRFQ